MLNCGLLYRIYGISFGALNHPVGNAARRTAAAAGV